MEIPKGWQYSLLLRIFNIRLVLSGPIDSSHIGLHLKVA